MYFLNEEEKKKLLRGLIPKSRRLDVADELRGWNWYTPPLEPPYGFKLALYEVANSYCPTNRDLFLRRVMGVKTKPNSAMIAGKILHQVLADCLTNAKRNIFNNGLKSSMGPMTALVDTDTYLQDGFVTNLAQEHKSELKRKIKILLEFETLRINARVQEVLSKQPYIGVDALVNQAIPIVTEQKLDGSFLGLSPNLSSDAFTFAEPMILDLKFGEPKPFHRLTTTGYAMVTEAIYEHPINIGCLVYAQFKDDRLIINRDLHIIDDELRQWFIEERDNKMQMIENEMDPGIAENCITNCPYYSTCREK